MQKSALVVALIALTACSQRAPKSDTDVRCENLERAGHEFGQRFFGDEAGAQCFLAGFEAGMKEPAAPVAMTVPDKPEARKASRSGPNPTGTVNASSPVGLRFRISYKALSMTPAGPRVFDGGEETLRYEEASQCWKRALEMMMRDKTPHVDVDCSSEDAYGVTTDERLRFELSCIEVTK